MLVDTHAHLYWEDYKDDLDQVIKKSLAAGVNTIINIAVDLKTSQEIVKHSYPHNLKVYHSIGIHPHEAPNYTTNPDQAISEDMKKLEQIYIENKDKVIQIGECGLDYFFQSNDLHPTTLTISEQKILQKKLLIAQIKLAKKLNLPLSIHCREAWDEIFDYLQDSRGILHCYSGQPQHTQKALAINFLISFAGNITYPKNIFLQQAAKTIPLDKIVIETDCPFLSPQSSRGKRNEPSKIKEIAQFIAKLKETTLENIAKQTTQNVYKLYNLNQSSSKTN